MKISRLDLLAFGPFTGVSLDFSSDLPGLHVVHGPNEAGKSTALRGLQALLFGFPPRTGDDFLHPYGQLLVGGRLRGNDGTELELRRRKKARNDLFDAVDLPLPPETLQPFLGGLDQDTFCRMYGIDHDRLVQGGQGILDQEGEVGQALFSAGAGFASIKTVLDGLEREAAELFRPRASKTGLSLALGRYKELQARLRQAVLGSQHWQAHHGALVQAQARLEELSGRRHEIGREIRMLERLRQALPFLGQRRDVQSKLDALGPVSPLPDDFSSRRREVEERIRSTQAELEGLLARHEACRAKLHSLTPDRFILEQADAIEAVHQGLGEYRKGQDDRPRLEGQRITFRTEAARLLRLIRPELTLDQVEPLRQVQLKRKAVQALEQEYAVINQTVTQARRMVRDATAEVESVRAELLSLGPEIDCSALNLALNQARKAGDLEREVHGLEAEFLQLEDRMRSRLAALGLWSGGVSDVSSACMPLGETIDRFEADLSHIEDELRQAAVEGERLDREQAALKRELSAVEQGRAVPDSQELQVLRERRDHGWSLVRRAWLDGEDIGREATAYDSDRLLPDAYEARVLEADQHADRMYEEAERVQKHGALVRELESVRGERVGLDRRIEACIRHREEVRSRWRQVWADSGVDPLSPREMRSWLVGFEALRLLAADRIRLERDQQLKAERLRELERMLAESLRLSPGHGLGFGALLDRAEKESEAHRAQRARRQGLERVVLEQERLLTKGRAEEKEARETLAAWQGRWERMMFGIGLAATALPGEGSDSIDALQKLFTALDEAETLRKRRDGIDRDAHTFVANVRRLAGVEEIGDDVGDVYLLVSRMKTQLGQALRQETLRQQQEDELLVLDKEILSLRIRREMEDAAMHDLMELAGTESASAIVEREDRWNRFRELRDRLDEIDTALARVAEDVSVTEMETQALTWSGEDLDGRLKELGGEADRLDPVIRELAEEIGREKNELSRMNGADTAACIGDEMQAELAAIGRMTGRYIKTVAAWTVLRREIERFRASHQDPLLLQASEIFQALTLNSFCGLRADLDESDRPVLIGVRPGEQRVSVEGMSSGTRDQLYLALRLASLDWQAESGNSMPFIIDDILINFDEMRSEAALRVLAGLADRIQIIMFTHQATLADCATGLGMSDRVFLHRL